MGKRKITKGGSNNLHSLIKLNCKFQEGLNSLSYELTLILGLFGRFQIPLKSYLKVILGGLIIKTLVKAWSEKKPLH